MDGVVADMVTFPGYQGDAISGYLARPDRDGQFPGVMLVHGINGLSPEVRRWTEEFATHGYIAVGTNMYSRFGQAAPDDLAAMVRAQGGLADAPAVGDVEGTVAFIRSLPYASGKVGIIGFCMGGRIVYLAACQLLGIDAVVDCWGGGVVARPETTTEARPVAGIEVTPNLQAPLLGLFGMEDRNPSPSHVRVMDETLTRLGKTYEFHSYPEVGHHFFANRTPAEIAATQDGWQQVYKWFGKYLA